MPLWSDLVVQVVRPSCNFLQLNGGREHLNLGLNPRTDDGTPCLSLMLSFTCHAQYGSPSSRFSFRKSGLISNPNPGPMGTLRKPLRTSGGLEAAILSR